MDKEMKNKLRVLISILIVAAVLVSISFLLFEEEIFQLLKMNNISLTSTARHVNFTRSADVPDLPFDDNPDPDQCGIPLDWGDKNQAWLTGYYEGELIEPIIHLYDSHLRLEVTAEAPHGTEVEVILFQENPVLDYYLVKVKGQSGPGSEGWIPAPLLSFDPLK
jgi:hypothetical protein